MSFKKTFTGRIDAIGHMSWKHVLNKTLKYTKDNHNGQQPAIVFISGSYLYGTDSPDSDIDLRGLTVAPEECIFGLGNLQEITGKFEIGADGGNSTLLIKKDIDYAFADVRKFVRFLLKGTPNMVELLFAPESHTLLFDPRLQWIWDNKKLFVGHMGVWKAYNSYIHAQQHRMFNRTENSKRFEQYAELGYEPKAASHILRLTFQGTELFAKRRITLPLPERERQLMLKAKEGIYTLDEIKEITDQAITEFDNLQPEWLSSKAPVKHIEQLLIEWMKGYYCGKD